MSDNREKPGPTITGKRLVLLLALFVVLLYIVTWLVLDWVQENTGTGRSPTATQPTAPPPESKVTSPFGDPTSPEPVR